MEQITDLIEQGYLLFNVNEKKQPVNANGNPLTKWNDLTYDELLKHHNYNSTLWGMRLGLQHNGRKIMSLDFDICGDKDKNGNRMGCPYTEEKLDEYLKNINRMDGMYSSSTAGNMNVLIDYTDCSVINDLVKKINSNKTNYHHLEILFSCNQVIPPSATTCKKTLRVDNPRTFLNDKPFYIINDNDTFIIDFISSLLNQKQKNIRCVSPVSPVNPVNPVNFVIENYENDKYLDLIFNVIGNERDEEGCKIITHDNWFQICGILKYNNYPKDIWLKYSSFISQTQTASKKWDAIKNNTPMSIYGLQNIAKKINYKGYYEWFDKWFLTNEKDIENPFNASLKLQLHLKETIKFCNKNWYILGNDNLWKVETEPTFFVLKEIHKHLDYKRDYIIERIDDLKQKIININADKKFLTDELDKYVQMLKKWMRFYTDINKPCHLSVLIKCLRPLLTDNNFVNQLDTNVGKLVFQNGIMDLKTGVFQCGFKSTDYITKTIPYDYVKTDYSFLKSVLLKILNNNEEHLEYFLRIIGYALTGDAELEKSIYFMIDKTENGRGDNGKTFFFDILNDLMPNYVYKSKANLIDIKNTKIHKQLAMLKGIRLLWLEELPAERDLNAELLKILGDGKQIENEVMFGTSETINVLFKLFALSNHIPKIDPKETAVYNRYKQISFLSHFDRTGTRVEEDFENLLFIADTNLSSNIKFNYYNEVFNLIIDYANQYYKNGIPAIPKQFINDTKETQSANDVFSAWFNENCVIENGERVALKKLVYESGFKEKDVKDGMSRLGFKYNKDLRKIGVDDYGKFYKGGYENIKFIEL
jgi:phage/plasmid-associated DNA primase